MSPERTATDQDDVQNVVDTLQAEVEAIRSESIGSKGHPVSIEFGGASSVAVNHGLGRQPTGWVQTDLVGAGVVVDREEWDKNTITFRATAACTFEALVY